jgi:pimeloyl-ACP methyl ester carboxylesterase
MEIVPESLRDPRIHTSVVDVADGLTFEVDQCGDGDELALCLHGFPEHSFSWRYQLPALAELGFTAWAPNLRGYGASSRPQDLQAYRLDELVEDVARLIEASGKSKVTLIAHDWGAVIAWQFALRQRLPLQRLIICNVPHPQAMQDAFGWTQMRKSWYVFFFQLPWLPEYALSRDNAKPIADAFANSAGDSARFPPEVCDVFRRNAAQPGALTAMINYYRGLFRGRRSRPRIDPRTPIDVPTLMIWGEDDVALDKSTTLTTGDYVTDFRIRYLPGVSHWVQQEQPEAVNAMISAFVLGQEIPEYSAQGELLPAERAVP